MTNSARLLVRTDRGVNAFLQAVRGVHDGLWLGLLGREALVQVDELYYAREIAYASDAYNLRGFWPWEADAIEAYFAGASPVIVTSAGGGREVLALARAGVTATGYEPNRRLAQSGTDLLHRNGFAGAIHPCNRDDWPAPGMPAGGVIIGWGAYSLIAGAAARRRLLIGARTSLAPGAPILVSFQTRAGRSLRFRAATAVGSPLRRLRGVVPMEYGDGLSPNFVHCFAVDDVVAELDRAGFEVVASGDAGHGWAVGRAQVSDQRSAEEATRGNPT